MFCAFNRRFDPSFSSVRSRVLQGAVGHVHMIKTTSRDSPLPSLDYLKISGGIFHDCAVHDIDLITWILGEYPSKVRSLITSSPTCLALIQVYTTANSLMKEIGEIDDHDNVLISLTFPSGSLGSIDLSRFANYGYDQRLEVFGAKGMLQVKNVNPDNTGNSILWDGLTN